MLGISNLNKSNFLIDVIDRSAISAENRQDENMLISMNPNIPYWEMSKDQVLDYVASATNSLYANSGSLLQSFAKNNAVRMVKASTFRWQMKGTGKSKTYSLENMMKGNTTPGLGNQEIIIKVNKASWQSSDTVYIDSEPSLRFSVQGPGIPDGTGTIYRLLLHTKSQRGYIDPVYLEPNITWCKSGASVSEGSGEYGSTYMGGTSLLTYETELGNYAKQFEVTDEGYLYALRLREMKPDGSPMAGRPEVYAGLNELEFLVQARWERENQLFWGRSAGKNIIDPSTGLHRRIGDGAIVYYEDGNLMPYHRNKLNVDFFRDMFARFFYNRVAPGKANIEIKAGIGFIMLLDEALTKEFSRSPIEMKYEDYVKPGATFPGSSLSGKHLTRPMLTGFDLAPYGTVKVTHLQVLDDQEQNGGKVDPKTGFPETSFWGFIDDVGIGTGNNVELLRREKSEFYNYVCGMLTPVGFSDQRNGVNTKYSPAHARRSYSIHHGVSEGIRFNDTKRSAFIFPSFSYA